MKHFETFTYEVILPDKGLEDHVSHFWCSRWNTGIQECINYNSTANTLSELVFAFAPGKQPVFSLLQGHTDKYCCLETAGLSELFGVSFYSHAIPYFFEASACDLVNQLANLGDFMRSDAEAMSYRLACADSFAKRVGIMTLHLKHKFNLHRKTDLTIINAIKMMRQSGGQVNIAALAKKCSLSQKQFERRFKSFSGFNPKLYSRILRFKNSFLQYNDPSYTKMALDLGYYDQAHFINDFKQFSGFSPRNYTPISP
jgi:AraC-like DNA-binding protein